MNVELLWHTDNADSVVVYAARVSNPSNQQNTDTGLLNYLMKHGHVSPFQMANMCLEITAPRDITRQIMRHWTMHQHELDAQEFSQRYQSVDALPNTVAVRQARMSHPTNRQASIECGDQALREWWSDQQIRLATIAQEIYQQALDHGIAKETARVVLPEGLTMSRIYLNGNLRSWIHYLQQRLGNGTQPEHEEVAKECLKKLRIVAPVIAAAFFGEEA